MKNRFYGTGVALATPFDDNNNIDQQALTKLVENQLENGVDYLVVLGSTGEAVTLTQAEKQTVKETVLKVNAGRVPLVLGMANNNTAQLLKTVANENLDGFDAILSVAPWYNKPTQKGLYEHFMALSKVCEKDIIIYNVPSRTGINIAPDTVLKLAQNASNIIGIKEAAGDMIQAMELVRILPKDFQVISGDDIIAVPMILSGSVGIISVLGQAFPQQFTKMIRLTLKGDVKQAYDLHYKFTEAIKLIFEEGNPVGIKALLSILTNNHFKANVRLPLLKASETLQEKMKKYTENF